MFLPALTKFLHKLSLFYLLHCCIVEHFYPLYIIVHSFLSFIYYCGLLFIPLYITGYSVMQMYIWKREVYMVFINTLLYILICSHTAFISSMQLLIETYVIKTVDNVKHQHAALKTAPNSNVKRQWGDIYFPITSQM